MKWAPFLAYLASMTVGAPVLAATTNTPVAWLNPLFVDTPESRQLLDEFRAWYLNSAMT